MEFDIVQFASRWLHMLAAAAAVGGALFMKFALHPASESLAPDARQALREGVRARWSKVVMAAITLLIATGVFNFLKINSAYVLKGTPYHALFGTKVLVALAVFMLASILTGRSALAQKLRADAGKWLTVLVVLAVTVVGLSSALKNLKHEPKPPTAATTQPVTPASP